MQLICIFVRPTHGGFLSSEFRQALLISALVCSVAPTLRAQWPAPITAGTRIRARLPETEFQMDGRRGLLLRGRVTALAPDTLYLAVGDSLGPLAVPRLLIERLEYSRGVPSRASSALRRGLIGAVGTAVLFVLTNELQDASDRTDWGTAAAVGAGFGLTFGGVLGALYPRERWAAVRLDESPQVRP